MTTAIQAQDVKLKVLDQDNGGELADTLHFQCDHCGKDVTLSVETAKLHHKMNEKQFYCNFCLRHRLYTKQGQHILMLSFRAIIAYYYHSFYRNNFAGQKMFLTQIRQYVASHVAAGSQNPVFFYDPESFIWYIDFSRVGKGAGKISVQDVIKTVSNILVCFNLPLHLSNVKMYDVLQKYREAIMKFYEHRNRPEGQRLLVPTLVGCGVYENQQNLTTDIAKSFTPSQLVRIDG